MNVCGEVGIGRGERWRVGRIFVVSKWYFYSRGRFVCSVFLIKGRVYKMWIFGYEKEDFIVKKYLFLVNGNFLFMKW